MEEEKKEERRRKASEGDQTGTPFRVEDEAPMPTQSSLLGIGRNALGFHMRRLFRALFNTLHHTTRSC